MAEPKLNARLGLDKKEFDSKLNDAQKGVKGFANNLKSVASAAAIAFGVRELVRFGAESVKVAANVEGIKRAFDNLNSPGLLNNLQTATKHTVADVDLMSAAVRANNFHIALDQLPKYFQFAAKRARDTGESIDYLVNSIVMGIGRKSPMILDNLGISLADINEELKKTPDYATAVGNIIARDIGAAGDDAETAADQVAQLSAAWANFKAEVGKGIISTGVTKVMQQLAESMRIMRDQTLTYSQKEEFKASPYGTYDAWNEKRHSYDNATGFNPMYAANMNIAGTGGWNMMSTLKPKTPTAPTAPGEGGALEDTILGEGYWQRATQAAVEYNNYIEANGLKIDTSAGAAALPSLSQIDSSQLAGNTEAITSATMAYSDQLKIISQLNGTFADMFSAGIDGWDSFGEAAVNAIANMLVQLASLAATYAVLSMIPGFSGFMETVGGLSGFVSNGMGWGKSASGLASGVGSTVAGDLNLRTEISGGNLAILLNRGSSSNYNNT